MSGIGDNTVGSAAGKDALQRYIERIENLEGEKKGYADDIRDVFKEAKDAGYDTKVMRKVIREKAKTKAQREEEQMLLDLYLDACGLL